MLLEELDDCYCCCYITVFPWLVIHGGNSMKVKQVNLYDDCMMATQTY